MRPITVDVARSLMCLCGCGLGTPGSPANRPAAKTDEQMENPSKGQIRVGPKPC